MTELGGRLGRHRSNLRQDSRAEKYNKVKYSRLPERYRPAVKAAFMHQGWCQGTLCVDDLVQVGMMAIEKAMPVFDSNLASWYTFAYRCAKTAIQRETQQESRAVYIPRRHYKSLHVSSLNKAVGDDEETTYLDLLKASRDYSVEVMQIFRLAAKTLPNRELDIFFHYWLDDETIPDLAKRLGVSNQRIGQLLQKALKRVREAIL